MFYFLGFEFDLFFQDGREIRTSELGDDDQFVLGFYVIDEGNYVSVMEFLEDLDFLAEIVELTFGFAGLGDGYLRGMNLRATSVLLVRLRPL